MKQAIAFLNAAPRGGDTWKGLAVDSILESSENSTMPTIETSSLPADTLADIQAVADAAAAGRPVDPEVARRVRERSEKVQEELLKRFGVREIAVDLIRQGREEA